MNMEAWKMLRDTVASLTDEQFNMTQWAARRKESGELTLTPTPPSLHQCDTVGCLAGWTCAMMNKKYVNGGEAADILGIGLNAKNHVFYGKWHREGREGHLYGITRGEALIYLDRAIAEQNPFVTIS